MKVALGGDGGDEAFGGYPRYRGVAFAETYQLVPAVLRQAMARLASGFIWDGMGVGHLARRAREFLAAGEATDLRAH